MKEVPGQTAACQGGPLVVMGEGLAGSQGAQIRLWQWGAMDVLEQETPVFL